MKSGLTSVKSRWTNQSRDQSGWNEAFSDYQSKIKFSDVVKRKPSHIALVFKLRILEEYLKLCSQASFAFYESLFYTVPYKLYLVYTLLYITCYMS